MYVACFVQQKATIRYIQCSEPCNVMFMLLLEAALLMGLRPTTCHPDLHSTSQSERQLLGGACVHKHDKGLNDMHWQTAFAHHPAGLHSTSVSGAACLFADTYYAKYQRKGHVCREHVQVSAER